MKHIPGVIFILGAIAFMGTFLSPIWRITLEAPQYPEGVTMYIWINKLSGDRPGTLQNINILNHYVGMKMIEPESIPELKYFPKIIIGMSILGIVLGFINNKKLWIVWGILLLILCVLGIYDFYLWEYDYGHNLADDAAIKVPGQAYQPPLFGSKKLLNFNALSYPYYGSIFILIPLILSGLAFYFKKGIENKLEKS
jgi:copper chaperone NosL